MALAGVWAKHRRAFSQCTIQRLRVVSTLFPLSPCDPLWPQTQETVHLSTASKQVAPHCETWRMHEHTLGTQPVTEDKDDASVWHFPVAVGSRFEVNLPYRTPGLTVGVNSDPEAISVECTSEELRCDAEENTIRVSSDEDLTEGIRAWVPERFCTVHVTGGLGGVSVTNINQGDLRVETKGGAVDLGKIRSEHVFISTGGGALTAKLLSGAICVNTHGGALTLGQAIGNQVTVNSGGGECRIRSVYAESFDLDSEGGHIRIETLGTFGRPPFSLAEAPAPVEATVRITAGAADIRVDKLDGAACLRTSGGNITVQLTDKTRLLELHMDGGHLTLCVPSSQTVPGDTEASSHRLEEGDIELSCDGIDFRALLASTVRDWNCQVTVEGSPRRITIKKGRGWMDALKEKMSIVNRTR